MSWLDTLVADIITAKPDGQILIESGASPSGTYHIGHLREIITCDALVLALRAKGRDAKHVHFVDDLDALRKIPVNIPAEYEEHLGKPLCDIPAPDGSDRSYGRYFLDDLLKTADILGIEMEVIYSHERYRSGFFVSAIELVLANVPKARQTLETISGRSLDERWTPIQIMEDGRLKNRTFVGINTADKTITYLDKDGGERSVRYDGGEVKLDWRLDWPGRWWLLHVDAEPFGRDHASAGGSFETGVGIMQDIYTSKPPIPVPYDFVNRAGDPKKMSASKGTGIAALEAVGVLPPEVVRYFMLQYPPAKRLYFDQADGVVRLVDEFAAFSAKPDRTPEEEQLYFVSTRGLPHRTVSRVPFSHLVASYQAALKDANATLAVIRRTEHGTTVEQDEAIILEELHFIEAWLEHWAPEDVKFSLRDTVDPSEFSEAQQTYLRGLAEKVKAAPADADGEWFHKAIYEFKEAGLVPPKELFSTLYRALIGKDSGPRAGWFLSLLPRDWLVARLLLQA